MLNHIFLINFKFKKVHDPSYPEVVFYSHGNAGWLRTKRGSEAIQELKESLMTKSSDLTYINSLNFFSFAAYSIVRALKISLKNLKSQKNAVLNFPPFKIIGFKMHVHY